LTGFFEKEIGVGHRSGGDGEIEQNEQIGEPERPADRSRVVDRLLDRLQIIGLLGNLREGRRRVFAAVRPGTPVRRGRIEPHDGFAPKDRCSRLPPRRFISPRTTRAIKRARQIRETCAARPRAGASGDACCLNINVVVTE
jgi:hypothetical protein